MRQRIENRLIITVDGVDLTTVTDILFWVRQSNTLFEYVPEVIDSETMSVTIPKEDAMKLLLSTVEMQFAFTDQDMHPAASEIVKMQVDQLLKESGYDTL